MIIKSDCKKFKSNEYETCYDCEDLYECSYFSDHPELLNDNYFDDDET